MSESFPSILSFEDALIMADALSIGTSSGKKRLLLGNGFSMACYGDFSYTTLYAKVKEMGLSSQIQEVFEQFGETNFEAILKLLDQSDWMAQHYRMIPGDKSVSMKDDYEMLKKSLAEAICAVHPSNSSLISTEKYESCYQFITKFDDIYTINYDLLLYWTSLRREPFAFNDGFSRDEDTDGHDCEFMPDHAYGPKNIYFLHGALHLYHDESNVRKRVWKDTGVQLIDQIKEALAKKQYPLVVAEGDSEHKLAQIQESSYLSNTLRKFKGIEGHLFVFGSSLSASDAHIVDIIAKNLELRHLWIGIGGDFERENNKNFLKISEDLIEKRKRALAALKKKSKKFSELEIHFYDRDSAQVWQNMSTDTTK